MINCKYAIERNEQVSQSNVKPDEHLYDTLELMLKQLQDEQVGSGSSSPELFPSLSAALVANPSHQLDSVGSVSIADPPADAAADVAADVASDLLDALIQGSHISSSNNLGSMYNNKSSCHINKDMFPIITIHDDPYCSIDYQMFQAYL